MQEIFRREALSVDFQPHSWQQAVTISGELLLANASIEAGYIQAMIDAVKELGPYMVVIPHVAIAHAAPATYVKANDLVLTVFKQPIYFNSPNDPVHIMFGLCALTPGSHLHHFQRIAQIFENEEAWRDFYDCDTVEQLYDLLNSDREGEE